MRRNICKIWGGFLHCAAVQKVRKFAIAFWAQPTERGVERARARVSRGLALLGHRPERGRRKSTCVVRRDATAACYLSSDFI